MTTSNTLRDELDSWLNAFDLRLSADQWSKIDFYLEQLEEYNRKTNITADHGDNLILRHIADGLAAVPVLRRLTGAPAPRILDLGSGGGFIGISIKIAWPDAAVTLLESAYRKFQFLNWIATKLALPELRVRWQRAGKSAASSAESAAYHVVIARAVAPLAELLPVARPLVLPNAGVLVAYQSQKPDPADRSTQEILSRSKSRLHSASAYRLPREKEDRYFAAFQFEEGA